MGRLNQSQRQSVAFASGKQVQNDILMSQTSGRSLQTVTEKVDLVGQGGAGFGDIVRDVINRGANAIANSDETARPRSRGEAHLILKLPNGKNGMANFMGPGTEVIKRLKRGDPGRTASDTVAKRHDIDFALAQGSSSKKEQVKKIRAADNRMIASLQKINKAGTDARRNVQLGLRGIQAKTIAEDAGVFPKGSFSGSLRTISPEDRSVLESNRTKLSQEGFGDIVLPGQELRDKLLRKARRARKIKSLGKQNGGFLGITIAAIIAAATAAAQAAALGAAGAAGALIVNKIAGNGLKDDIASSIKKAVKGVKIAMSDLTLKGKMALKSTFEKLKSDPTKDAIKSAGKKLASHFRDALAKKVKEKLGMAGGAISMNNKAFEKAFVSKLKKSLRT